jgi:hypothetical protein
LQYYRKILRNQKKPSDKVKGHGRHYKAVRWLILTDQLGFEFSEIAALKQYLKSEESVMVTQNDRPLLITDGSDEARQRDVRCHIFRVMKRIINICL